jgi:hypothetical protein
MGKNLAGKSAFIVGVLLVFVFGFIGVPHGSLKESILNRIHLGLDLQVARTWSWKCMLPKR